MAWLCAKCGKDLFRHPKIIVHDRLYCFLHAKRRVAEIAQAWEAAHAEQNKEYAALLRRRQDDEERHEAALCLWERELQARTASIPLRRAEYAGQGSAYPALMAASALGVLASLLVPSARHFWVLAALAFGVFYWRESKRQTARAADFDSRVEHFLPTPPRPEPLPPFAAAKPADEMLAKCRRLHRPAPPTDGSAAYGGEYRLQVLRRDGHTCQKCGQQHAAKHLEVHHVIPREWFGTDHPTNLITLCQPCHLGETWYGHRHKENPDAPWEPGSYGPVWQTEAEKQVGAIVCVRDRHGNILMDDYTYGLIHSIHGLLATLAARQDSADKRLSAVFDTLAALSRRVGKPPLEGDDADLPF